jgi:hypothetical protein
MPLTGHCHCGRNAFEVDGELPQMLTRCTCSFCSKRGHLYAYYPPERFKVTEALSDAVYRWNTRQVHNHFCSACGCDLYADSPDFQRDGSWDGKTRRIAVNARPVRRLRSRRLAGDGHRRQAPLVNARAKSRGVSGDCRTGRA